MLLIKVRNAAELLWDSLDSRERMLVVYAGAWLVFMTLLSAQRKSRDRLRREIVEELSGAGGPQS
jgi:hypothetical protein